MSERPERTLSDEAKDLRQEVRRLQHTVLKLIKLLTPIQRIAYISGLDVETIERLGGV